jgi:hypothetical protein
MICLLHFLVEERLRAVAGDDLAHDF